MELKVKNYTLPNALEFNYEELKAEITERVSQHTNLVYTNDQITDAKKDVAMLRKFTKALSDERIRIKKDFLKPYDDFEKKIKELTGIVDIAIANIDGQIKAADEQRKAEKKEKVFAYLHTKMEEIPAGICFPHNEKWWNVSTSIKSIEEEIDSKIEQIKTDLSTLSNLPEFAFEATEVYKSSLNITKALQEAHRLSEQAKRKAEYEAAQAKRKAEYEAEQARKKAEADDIADINKKIAESGELSQVPEKEHEKQFITFKALLTVQDAIALKNFFESRNIDFWQC